MLRTSLLVRRYDWFAFLQNRLLAALGAAVVGLGLFADDEALAIQCEFPFPSAEHVRESLGRADIVFVGKIQSIGKPVQLDGWSQSVQAEVAVEQIFKNKKCQIAVEKRNAINFLSIWTVPI